MNKIFKNEKSLFGKLEKLFWKFYEKEAFRFLIAGGLNTLLGTIGTILLRFVFEYFTWNAKIDFTFLLELGLVSPNMDIPYLIIFVAFFPIAYTLQAKISFQTKWEWKRLFMYPISSIPNFLCQELFIWLFEVVIGLPSSVAYILSPICSLPIMFFIIRVLVKPFKKNINKRLKDIKYVFCDIDGTLVNSNAEINEETIKYIKEYQNKDKFYLISGRNYLGIKQLYDKLELKTPLICGNGAIIADKEKNIIQIKTIPNNMAKIIFDEYKNMNISVSVYDDFNWYVNKQNEYTNLEEKIVNFKPTVVDNINDVNNITKIMIIGEEEKIKTLFKTIKKDYPHLMVIKSKPNFIEIMNKKVDKGKALAFLKKYEHIQKKEIMAIGDSMVDVKMFKECSVNIVVQNASEEVKKYADKVVPSNDENGVIKALELLN